MPHFTLPQYDSQERLDHKKFELAVRRLSDSLNYGSDTSIFLGSGIDFAQSRLYQDGDNIKLIDWKVTARTNKYHVKEYEATKSMGLWLLLDTSSSMHFSSAILSKYAMGLQIATSIGLLAQQRLSPVGFLGVGEQDIRLESTLSKNTLMQHAMKLLRYNMDEKTSLLQRANELCASLKNRAMVMIISDFHDPESLTALKRLSAQHDTVAIHLSDPIEFQKNTPAIFRAQEAETKKIYTGLGSTQWFDFKAFERSVRIANVDYIHLHTMQKIIPPLRYFLSHRGLLGRQAR